MEEFEYFFSPGTAIKAFKGKNKGKTGPVIKTGISQYVTWVLVQEIEKKGTCTIKKDTFFDSTGNLMRENGQTFEDFLKEQKELNNTKPYVSGTKEYEEAIKKIWGDE